MNNSLVQIVILAGIALFLILKLRSVLGTRDGFEKPSAPAATRKQGATSVDLRVVEPADDRDISDHVAAGTASFDALSEMKKAEPDFSVSEFLGGSRKAYEMILMAFERGEIEEVRPFLSEPVYASFESVVSDRKARGEVVEAQFIGVSGVELKDAAFDTSTHTAELTVSFKGELASVVKNVSGEIVSGDPNEVVRQIDTWTFARKMGTSDPNWQLVATQA